MLGWLRRVASSPHRDRLVLRGSLLTSAWCPGRRAADVDHLVLGGFRVDLGQGDELPHPPAMVSIDGSPEVLGVTPETMFGWKTDGLFQFGHGSWRAKDLYDLWLIDRHVVLSQPALVTAVGAAFEHQGLELAVADRFLFSGVWGASRGSRRRWESFGRRSGAAASHDGLPGLAETIAHVRGRLLPIFAALGHIGPRSVV